MPLLFKAFHPTIAFIFFYVPIQNYLCSLLILSILRLCSYFTLKFLQLSNCIRQPAVTTQNFLSSFIKSQFLSTVHPKLID